MDYQLAKQLKDAGFPQYGSSQIFIGNMGTNLGPNSDIPTACYVPTLSELIEACGEAFGYLSKGFNDPRWYAGKAGNKDRDVITEGAGSTPEESVARLWLVLNQPPKEAVT